MGEIQKGVDSKLSLVHQILIWVKGLYLTLWFSWLMLCLTSSVSSSKVALACEESGEIRRTNHSNWLDSTQLWLSTINIKQKCICDYRSCQITYTVALYIYIYIYAITHRCIIWLRVYSGAVLLCCIIQNISNPFDHDTMLCNYSTNYLPKSYVAQLLHWIVLNVLINTCDTLLFCLNVLRNSLHKLIRKWLDSMTLLKATWKKFTAVRLCGQIPGY